MKFYKTGDLPRKNVEVIAEAVEAHAQGTKIKRKIRKRKGRFTPQLINLHWLDSGTISFGHYG